MTRILAGSLGLVLLLACSSPAGERLDVSLTPAQEAFAPGEPATVLLMNRSRVEIGYGACDPRLEQATTVGWVLVGPEAVPCIGIGYVLGAGASTELQVEIGPELDAGLYRFRMTIHPGTGPVEQQIHSPPFHVLPCPTGTPCAVDG